MNNATNKLIDYFGTRLISIDTNFDYQDQLIHLFDLSILK